MSHVVLKKCEIFKAPLERGSFSKTPLPYHSHKLNIALSAKLNIGHTELQDTDSKLSEQSEVGWSCSHNSKNNITDV